MCHRLGALDVRAHRCPALPMSAAALATAIWQGHPTGPAPLQNEVHFVRVLAVHAVLFVHEVIP